MFTFFRRKFNKISLKGFFKTPFFGFGPQGFKGGNLYFGLMAFVLLGLLFNWSDNLAEANYSYGNDIVFFNSFFENTANTNNNDLFFGQNKELALETPDLKIIQGNSIYAVSTPTILTTQTLGDIFGGSNEQRKEITEIQVQIGETVSSIANQYGISPETIAWANNISKNSTLKVGQTLTILPVSGIVYTVKNGDTLTQIIKNHSDKNHPVNIDDVVAYNNLTSSQDIFIGDTLIFPGAIILPQVLPPVIVQIPVAGNYYINPAQGIITQGLHFENAIDLANKCGTSIYAAASGVVQRAVSNGKYNFGMGNYITILHSNGTVTYYGHEEAIFVKSGDVVTTGDRIGLMGKTGKATGCHVHFQVIGAQNPLARFAVGTTIKYSK